jgi:two-component system, sensor histidine kinase
MNEASEHPGATSATDCALSRTYQPILRGLAGILALYYAILSVAHLNMLPGSSGIFMAGLATASAIFIGFLRFGPLSSTPTLRTLEMMTTAVILIIGINICVHARVANDPIQFIYLPVIVTASALVGPTQRALRANLAITACAGVMILLIAPGEFVVPFVFTGVTALVVGLIAGRWKIAAVMEQAELVSRAEALAAEAQLLAETATRRAEMEEQANAAKGAFLANMSHELRTPLNGIIGVASALKGQSLASNQREMVELIEKSGSTLAALVSDILDLAKIDAGKLEVEPIEFDLRDELQPVLDLQRTTATTKALSFDTSFADSANGLFRGDPTRLKQVLTNLCNNAVKFTATGGVSVNVDYCEMTEMLNVSVSDTGIGFPTEKAAALFERFSQADLSTTRTHGGTGLGLSICHALCSLMGGSIRAESVPGSGSCFSFSIALPRTIALSDYVPSGSQPDDLTWEDLASEQLSILLAEDHPANQAVVRMLLEPLGVQLTIVENGASAVAALSQQHYDLVLMDMQMPVMDGLMATRAIRTAEARQGQRYTPIIMLTANAMTHHRVAAEEAGADLHVSKPVTPSALYAAINVVLDTAAEAQEAQKAGYAPG